MNKLKKDSFFEIAKDISTTFGTLLGVRPYIGIIDAMGTVHYSDTELEEYMEFAQNFARSNFYLLNTGDHSLPLGGINLAFFKISEKSIIVLYTKKGRSGQLLSFKAKMFDWQQRIDGLIGDIIVPPPPIQVTDSPSQIELEPGVIEADQEVQTKARGLRTIPVLIKQLTGKEKFPIDVATILQYCDGNYSIDDIVKETNYPRLQVDNVIRLYQKKKWIDIKRVL